ncbi:riboflavin kinase [Bacillus sp. FJAT-49705]|uniref:riboflavin kinase n=1 Tax=Cytobacillus citreus TaxID=2833586 RepID=A0ABS5NX44_9BACI|nr:riboflavin kinase [Cytobacillus citreus]MBS4192395.1 riboflavin kinase [Cytobacillus citreus]
MESVKEKRKLKIPKKPMKQSVPNAFSAKQMAMLQRKRRIRMAPVLSTLEGVVIKGNQLGRTIGFPTANLSLTSPTPRLKHGVYGVSVTLSAKQFYGIMNIGIRPTIHDHSQISYEVHLFDFNQNIYHERLTVDLLFFVRKEISFPDKDELVQQICRDVELVRNRFALLGTKKFPQPILYWERRGIPNQDEIPHLPDLSFVQFCEEEFGVNRGVYNVIDSWFFHKGSVDILERRNKIIHFLLYMHHSKEIKPNGRMKIGKNGLSAMFDEFLNSISI